MEPSRVDRILEEWAAVTGRTRRPATSPRRSGVTAGRAGATLAGAGPLVVVTTRPVTVNAADGGSTMILADAPAFEPGTMVTAIRLPFSDSAADGARETVDSFFWS